MYLEYVNGNTRDSFKTIFRECASYSDAFENLTTQDAMSLNKEIEDALEDAGNDEYDYELGYQLLREDFLLRGGDKEDF